MINIEFFLACTLLGLEYLHANKIIHKDIKPENLVLDDKGYLKINDFGIAKIYKEKNCKENGGTPGYISPEVICGQNHTYTADYFAIGVMAYEFMLGKRPYKGKNKQEVKDDILSRQAILHHEEKPCDWSSESVDFINKLIERKKEKRLGVNGIRDIKAHQWFNNFPWSYLYFHKLKSPFIPNKIEKYLTIENAYKRNNINIDKLLKIIGSSQYEKSFKNFYYFNREDFMKTNKLNNFFVNPHLSQYKNEIICKKSNYNKNINNEKKDQEK